MIILNEECHWNKAQLIDSKHAPNNLSTKLLGQRGMPREPPWSTLSRPLTSSWIKSFKKYVKIISVLNLKKVINSVHNLRIETSIVEILIFLLHRN